MKYSYEGISGKEEYYEKFNNKNNNQNYKEALKNALDIRKFEIEMYWKRTAYFWAITALVIAGYFILLKNNNDFPETNFLTFLISSIGVVFSFVWYLVNRGSKYWQRNWELHVDMLEDKVYGPLYKLNINPTQFNFWNLTDAYRVSVSRLNQLLSLFITIFWIYLFISQIFAKFSDDLNYIIGFTITFFFLFILFWGARFKQKSNIKKDFLLRVYE